MPEQMNRRQVNSGVEEDLQPDIARGTLKLHAMGFTDLLDTTFSLYRGHFWSFLRIATLYFLAMLIGVSISFLDDWIGGSAKTTIWVFTIGAILCISVFVVSALVSASAQAYLDGKIRIGTVLKQAKRQFFPCLVSSLIFGLITFLAIFLIVVLFVAIYTPFESGDISRGIGGLGVLLIIFSAAAVFVTYWCFYISATFVEGISAWTELRRSRELIRGRWWRINGMMLAIFLLHFGISFIFRTAFGILLTLTGLAEISEFFGTVQWLVFLQLPRNLTEFHLLNVLMHLVNLGIDAFTMPIWVIGGTLLYFDQRIRQEGFDIEVMATRRGE
jgi:hypothetical protein